MLKHAHFQEKNNNSTSLSMINYMTQRYEKYKDSGVQWLGEIPEHWEIKKIKYLFKERSEKNHPEEPMLSATQTEGVILQSKYKNRVVVVNTGFEGLKLVKVGDFVIHLRSFQGGIEYAYDQGIISSAYTILQPNNEEYSEFYKYLLKCSNFIDLLKICVTGIREGQNINYSKLKQYQMPLPPLSKQHAIVSYLDEKCGMIDKILAGKQKQIELLGELKQRIIADAVTRGLNPDVKLNNTNIPWLPQIPEHWEITTLKRFLRLVSEKNHPDKPLLSVTREQGVIVRDMESKEENHNFIPEDLSGYKYVEVGDFCINKMKSWQGSYGVSKYEGIVSPAYFTCKLNGVDKEFFSTAIRSKIYVSFFARYSKGIRVDQWDLSPIGLMSIPFALPPLSEQRAIVNYINERTSKIDTLSQKLQQEIDNIKEYKQRLISDVVTGQIKVC